MVAVRGELAWMRTGKTPRSPWPQAKKLQEDKLTEIGSVPEIACPLVWVNVIPLMSLLVDRVAPTASVSMLVIWGGITAHLRNGDQPLRRLEGMGDGRAPQLLARL